MNNLVMLTGNVGGDPALKVLAGGRAMLRLRVATSDMPREGREPRTDWHSVVVWGKTAERVAPLLAKGARVVVSGKLRSGSYDKQGTKVSTYEVEAMSVEVVAKSHSLSATPPPAEVVPAYEPNEFVSGIDDDVPF